MQPENCMAPHAWDNTAPELLPGHSQRDLQDVQPLLALCHLSRAIKLINKTYSFPNSQAIGKKARLKERTEVHSGIAKAFGRKWVSRLPCAEPEIRELTKILV